jgi:hypothetical protein
MYSFLFALPNEQQRVPQGTVHIISLRANGKCETKIVQVFFNLGTFLTKK